MRVPRYYVRNAGSSTRIYRVCAVRPRSPEPGIIRLHLYGASGWQVTWGRYRRAAFRPATAPEIKALRRGALATCWDALPITVHCDKAAVYFRGGPHGPHMIGLGYSDAARVRAHSTGYAQTAGLDPVAVANYADRAVRVAAAERRKMRRRQRA